MLICDKCSKGVVLYLPDILRVIFQTDLACVLELILDKKFFHKVRLEFLMVLRALPLLIYFFMYYVCFLAHV